MQASLHTFDPGTTAGSVILDTGKVVPFAAEAFDASGLRHLRVGQRLSIELTGDPEVEGTSVSRLWIVGIGADQTIR
ncbi:hypothetical protein MWU75_04145 [Ornithinimicrobium sp. F0845]|uniref:hypothetical protein n=1 Tax=Ornithinimicrobium sp. F0845 TaxID=2926412 RepID=UPI001FF279FB|nr:hypothetical protein [Ornithinimicrobium sp. F0845]MCK0111328.1 hypothetical protein [Ornithinimicrobium sp. F0845]